MIKESKLMLKTSAQRVQDRVKELGMDFEVVQYPATTRTAKEAASTIGCPVSSIVKSLIFQYTKESTDMPILVLIDGDSQVNEKKLSEILGAKIRRPNAKYVRDITGFAIGGIPPVGHKVKIRTIIDKGLLNQKVLCAAAGTPNAVFLLPADKIVALTNGELADIKS